MATKELFDKKFVIGAIILGIIYALIVVLVGAMLGKDAAGVAGVALTALATALFRKYETLQFRRMSDDEAVWVGVPPVNIWHIVLYMFAYFGASHLLALVLALVFPEPWLSFVRFIVISIAAALILYFALSFVMAKAIPHLRYSTVAIAVVLSQITTAIVAFTFFRPLTMGATEGGMGPLIGVDGTICLIFEVVALFGVRLGLPTKSRVGESSTELLI